MAVSFGARTGCRAGALRDAIPPVCGFGPLLDSVKLPCLHQSVAKPGGRSHQPPGCAHEQRIDTLDKTWRDHGLSRSTRPLRAQAPSHEQACRSSSTRLKEEFPAHEETPAGGWHGQDEITPGLDDSHDEGISRAGERRHHVARCKVLKLGNNRQRARPAAVVHPVVTVPPRATSAHLHEPRPNSFHRRCDRHGVHDHGLRVRDQRVAGERPLPLLSRRAHTHQGADRCEGRNRAFMTKNTRPGIRKLLKPACSSMESGIPKPDPSGRKMSLLAAALLLRPTSGPGVGARSPAWCMPAALLQKARPRPPRDGRGPC